MQKKLFVSNWAFSIPWYDCGFMVEGDFIG